MQFLTALFAALATLTNVGKYHGPCSVLKASQDPFYSDAPANLAQLQHGDVISVRPLTNAIVGLVGVSGGHQVRFRSSDSRGKPIMAVLTVVLPEHASNSSRVVFYQYWENSIQIDCCPSYKLLTDGLGSPYPQAVIDQGWPLVLTDHLGPASVFGAGEIGGHITLDSVRALTQTDLVATDGAFEAVLWGYSGGSLPTAWATQMQPEYAPELAGKVVGSAFGGVMANMTVLIDTLGRSEEGAGHGPSFAFSLAHEYPEFAAMLDREWNATTRTRFSAAFGLCNSENNIEFANESFYGHFKSGAAAFSAPEIRKLFHDHLDLGQGLPQIPMYVYEGGLDNVTAVAPVTALVDLWCQHQAPVTHYVIDPTEDHNTMVAKAIPAVLAWFQERFDHALLESACPQFVQQV